MTIKQKKTILVTGGAGYIGSATVKKLLDNGNFVIVVDNLSKGDKKLVDSRAKFYHLDLTNKEDLKNVFSSNKIDAIIHFAAYKSVEESMTNTSKYIDNISGTINLLNLMVEYNISKIVFSSTAAVYGNPNYLPIDELHSTIPINFYGFTKLECEKIIEWYSKIHGIKFVNLRYFNVAGDAGLNYFDKDARNVFPILMDSLVNNKTFAIFGNDYDTYDGTCVRDYIDINDLIEAHIQSLEITSNHTINLGTSHGISVLELVNCCQEISGKKIKCVMGKRRLGDSATIIASNNLAKKILDWEPKKKVEDMVKSTYNAYLKQK